MHLIPNGIDPSPFAKTSQKERGQKEILQLGFLGRLEHNQKGVMHIPNLVKNLNALEIPVVSSPITVNKEIVLDNENGFLVNSTQKWIEALEELITNNDKRNSFGLNGYNKIISEFSIKSTSKLIFKKLR